MDKYEKMGTCKYHRYIDDFHDKCLKSGTEYSCDAPEDLPLWEVCKKCKDYIKDYPHIGAVGECEIFKKLQGILDKYKNEKNIFTNRYNMIQEILKYLSNWNKENQS